MAGTVMRMSWEPAAASSLHWATVASMSDVWVLHIVCTTMGWPLPMRTFSPTRTVRVSNTFFILFILLFGHQLAGQLTQLGAGVAITGG